MTAIFGYSFFHSLAEMFRVAVAVAIFMLIWSVRRSVDNGYLVVTGVAYVFVGMLDILHSLAARGAGVFAGAGPDLQAQLWVAARCLEAGSLLGASFVAGRRLNLAPLLAGYAAATAVVLGAVLDGRWVPACFTASGAPTPFRRLSEYAVSVIVLAALARLIRVRRVFDEAVFRLLAVSVGFTFLSELSFSLQPESQGALYRAGHLLKILAFYFIYRAIVETGVAKPVAVLFRSLDARVRERTADLDRTNERLRVEIAERRRVEEALRESETKYRTVADNTYNWEWWRGPGGGFIYVSPSCQRITRHSADEFIADPDLLLRLVHPDDRTIFLKHLAEVENGSAPGEAEFRIILPDRSIRWLAHVCQPVFDAQGGNLGRRGSNRDITERRRAGDALRQSEKRLRELSSRLLTAQETERRRVSRELHDELGGALAVLKMRTSAVERKLSADQQELREECRRNLVYIDQIIENVSRLSRDLSPSILEDIGLTPALRRLADNFSKNFQVRVEADIADVGDLLSGESQVLVYRIFQEAFNNIGKHAAARNVSILVRRDDDRVSCVIEDDGRGFDAARTLARKAADRGLGLATMDERARMLGGTLLVSSRPGRGTRLTLSVPLSREKEEP